MFNDLLDRQRTVIQHVDELRRAVGLADVPITGTVQGTFDNGCRWRRSVTPRRSPRATRTPKAWR